MFDWLFGRKKGPAPGPARPEGRALEGEPLVRLQMDYWTHRPAEQADLRGRGWGALAWPERLRLHHQNCLALLAEEGDGEQDVLRAFDRDAPASEARLRCRESVVGLIASDSPYRPRNAQVWQGQLRPDRKRPPDLRGPLTNASVTHLGSLEVVRLDEAQQPRELAFVAFDDVSLVGLASPSLFRAARVFYEAGRGDEIVLVPMLYGPTWHIGDEYCRRGQMTQFRAHLGCAVGAVGEGPLGSSGIGLGQQDLTITGALFGIGSVAEVAFALEMVDPRFDEKCRGRGIDPEEVRARFAEDT